MKQEETGKEFFSKKFIIFLLAISILTNMIVLTKYNFPDILNNIQIMFIPAPEVLPTDHIRGNPKAKITIIEYADFQCSYCVQFHEAMKTIMKESDVRWIYRHFPLSFHESAGKAAEAAECAGDQGKFWEYADALFAFKGEFSDKVFIQSAQRVGLNTSSFGKCLKSGKHTSTVVAQHKDGVNLKISGTPTFYLNGKRFNGNCTAR